MDVMQPCPRCGGDPHEGECRPVAPGVLDGREVARRGPRRPKYAPDPLRGTLGFARATYLTIAILSALAFVLLTFVTRADGREPDLDVAWYGGLASMLLHALAAAAVRTRPALTSVSIAALQVTNLCSTAATGGLGFAMILATGLTTLTSVLAWKITSQRGVGERPASTFSRSLFVPFALLSVVGAVVFFSAPHRPARPKGAGGAPGEIALMATFEETERVGEGAWAARSSDDALDWAFASFLGAWESGSLDSVSAEFEENVRDEVAQRLRDRFQDETGSIVLPDLTEASFGPSGTNDPFVRIDFDGGVLFVNFTRADDAWTASSLEIR